MDTDQAWAADIRRTRHIRLPAGHRHARGWQTGEVFSVVRPEVSKEMEQELREMVQEMLEEDLL